MKALARYQIILLGEQRHIGVNNLPKVLARQCSGWESNPRSANRESSALTTTTPPSHSDTPVSSMSGHLVADDSTTEELLWRGRAITNAITVTLTPLHIVYNY